MESRLCGVGRASTTVPAEPVETDRSDMTTRRRVAADKTLRVLVAGP